MPLTKTSHLTEFHRPAPSSATFAFPKQSPDNPSTTITITLPPLSTYTTSPHFHVTHTEYIHVLSGAALITISNQPKIYTANDGVVFIPPYARHEWMRFDRPAYLLSRSQQEAQEAWMRENGEEGVEELRDEDLVVEEWTEPRDGQKEIFFRNLFSTIGEERVRERWVVWLQLMVVMWEGDNFEVVWDLGGGGGGWRGRMERGVSYGVIGGAALVGRGVGLRAVREEYTPEGLLGGWERGRGRGRGRKKGE